VEVPLEGIGVRRWILLGPIVIAALLTWQAVEIGVANYLIESQSAKKIERGIRLVPGNADGWDRLGRFRQWDLTDPDSVSAIGDYKTAVALEPTSPYYWLDLASGYEDAGDSTQARDSYQRAGEIYPASADVAWRYGNFLLRQGMFAEGMTQISKAVRGDSSLLPEAVSRVWRSSRDVNLIINQLLASNLDSYFEAIDFFDTTHEPEPGLAIWQKAVTLGKPFALPRSFPFIEELIRDDRSEDAEHVWLKALQMAGIPNDVPDDHSVVWDGGFARSFTNGGLGWRWEPPLGVAIDFDSPRQFSGTRSVRLDFGGSTNLELDEPRQYVPVEPNRTYNFRGYLRTERISTESGLRFSVVDPHHNAGTNVTTDNLTETNGWTEVNAQIRTSDQTHFLLVRVFRYPSRLFENKLSGSAWIADISLIPTDAADGPKQ
jgi:tetratricopeptide (TPR) repeat protein